MKDRFITIIFIIIYYILVMLGGFFNLIFGFFCDNIIGNTSIPLFYLLYIILPFFLLLIPIFLYIIFKKQSKKILQYSYIILLIFILLFFSISLGIKAYFSKFSKDKWEKFSANRYYMIDDIEKNYDYILHYNDDIIVQTEIEWLD